MQVIGTILCLATYVLISLNIYGFFSVVAQLLKKRLGVFFGLVWIAIGLSLVYNIVFNHFWAMVIKPGCPKDLLDNESLRKEIKNRESRKAAKVIIDGDQSVVSGDAAVRGSGSEHHVQSEDDRFEGLQKDVKRLMKYRTKTMGNLKGFWNKKCTECNELKPARTHHCSVCDTCVFQMSHHCVFTNNCVGLENQRFFLLFILYTLIGSCYMVMNILLIWNTSVYRANHGLMSFLLVFNSLLSVCLIMYNLWSWFIAGSGLTTIEFMGRNTGYKMNAYDFTFQRVRDNLFKIFGTKSYFEMLSPSLRYNPFNGIEWSFQMKDLGFNEFGEPMSAYGGNDEESSRAKPASKNIEMTKIMPEEDGEEEAENTEIAI